MQKLRLGVALSLSLFFVSCKQNVADSSNLQGATSIGSAKVDLTTFKATTPAMFTGMKNEMKKNGFDYAALEKGLGKTSLKGLKKEEAVAIRLYTSPAYQKINTILRTKSGSSIASLANIVKVTSAGLNKLPSKSCTVKRGLDLPANIVDKIIKIKRFEEDAFMSTTSGEIPPAFRKNITFIIKSTKCRDVAFLSEYASEKEILFPPGSEFSVVSSTLKKTGSVYKGTLTLKHEAGGGKFKAVLSGAKQNIVALFTGVDKNDYPVVASAKKKAKAPAASTAKGSPTKKTKLVGDQGFALTNGMAEGSEDEWMDPMLVDWGVDTEIPDAVETARDISDSNDRGLDARW